MFIFIEKLKNRVELYGCAKVMFDIEKEFIKIGIGHFYNKVAGDYENDLCIIYKRELVRAKHFKVEKVPEPKPMPKEIPMPDPIPIPIPVKIDNVPLDSYVKRNGTYLINIDGVVFDIGNSDFEHKNVKYRRPGKIFGSIKDLI